MDGIVYSSMKKIIFILTIAIMQLGFSQANVQLPFVGMKSFSFCEGNACESEITITKNGNCKIVSYGFGREESRIEYEGKYQAILWIYEKGKKAYGYKIVGKNTIFQVGLNGKIKKDCFYENQVCKSYLYYYDKKGHLQY